MAIATFNLNNFSGGEIAPEFWTRTDLQKYGSSVRSSHNGYARLDGSWNNRQGFQYIATTKNSGTATNTAIPYTFKFSNQQSYALIFENMSVRFMQNFGNIGQVISGSVSAYNGATAYNAGDMAASGGVTYYCIAATTGNAPPNSTYWYALSGTAPNSILELPTPYVAADIRLLKFAQSGDVLYIAHQNYPPATLTRLSATAWQYSQITFGSTLPAPTGLSDSAGTSTTAPTLSLNTAGNGSPIYACVTAVGSAGESPASNVLLCQRNNNTTQAVIQWTAVTGATSYNLYLSSYSTGPWLKVVGVTSTYTIMQVNPSGTSYPLAGSGASGFCVTALDASNKESLPSNIVYGPANSGSFSWNAVTGAGAYKLYQQSNGVWGLLALVQGANTWTYPSGVTLVADTSKGIPLINNPFVGTGNYPAVVNLYQGRTWWGNTLNYPKTFWASRTGDYTNLQNSSKLVDSDAISYTIAEEAINGILCIIPMPLGALMPTGGTVFWMTSPNDGPITGTTPPQIKTQSNNFGMSPYVQPIVVGNRMVYFDNSNMRCRDAHYQIYEYSYGGNETSIYAKHLFSPTSQITSWAYINYPDSTIWMAKSDGTFVSLGYQREQDSAEFISWAHHDTPSGATQVQGSTPSYGFVQGFCSTPNSNGTSNLWATINRIINGQSVTYIEMMGPRYFTSAYDATFLDSWKQYNSPITITGISKATTCTVTAPSHGLSNGDIVRINKVVGMDQLFNTIGTERVNGTDVTAYFPTSIYYIVSDVLTNSFKIKDAKTGAYINSSTFNAYISGGVAYKCLNSFTAAVPHLASTPVYVVADGDILQLTAGADGTITLPQGYVAGILTVGLPYLCEMWTNSPEYNSPTGTTQDKMRGFKSAYVTVINTRGLLVGVEPTGKLTQINYTKASQWSNPLQLAGYGSVKQSDMVSIFANDNVREATLYVQVPYGMPATVTQIAGTSEIGPK